MIKIIQGLIQLARPKHTIKNLLVGGPAFFAGSLWEAGVWSGLALAFVVSCLAASAVYVFNDWRDREHDRDHPEKAQRPLSSGLISAQQALWFGASLMLSAWVVSWVWIPETLPILWMYWLLNAAYSLGLKRVPILDVSIISAGFGLRLMMGSLATHVPVSPWMMGLTLCLALFLGLAKRRTEVALFEQTGRLTREVVRWYRRCPLDGVLLALIWLLVLAYSAYGLAPLVNLRQGSPLIALTAIPVAMGLFRYRQLNLVRTHKAGPTHLIWHDRRLQLWVLMWFAIFFGFLYGSFNGTDSF